jgi:hypothetical protein
MKIYPFPQRDSDHSSFLVDLQQIHDIEPEGLPLQ